MSHWTQGSVNDFVYNISLDFFAQLEDEIEKSGKQRKEVAENLGVTPSAVSQILNSPPEKPEVETLVKYAFVLGRKVAIVLYNDDDPGNERGPVYSGIFEKSWEALHKPRDFSAVDFASRQIVPVTNNNMVYQSRSWIETPYILGDKSASQTTIERDWYKRSVPSAVGYLGVKNTPVVGRKDVA